MSAFFFPAFNFFALLSLQGITDFELSQIDPADMNDPANFAADLGTVPEVPENIEDAQQKSTNEPEMDYFARKRAEAEQLIQSTESKSTSRKTNSDISHITRWLEAENYERRPLENIPKNELEIYLSAFFGTLKNQLNGEEVQPGTIRCKEASVNRYLKAKGSDVRVNTLALAKNSITAKQKVLKEKGLGNRPNKADAISVEEEEILWNSQMLLDNPQGLLNAMWYRIQNMCGQRGNEGARQMLWGDFELKSDENQNRYLEFNERATKTRSGADLSNVRDFPPKMWELPNTPERCPVNIYLEYTKRRPLKCLTDTSPFFLAIKHNRRADDEKWFKNQPMGEKLLTTMMKTMSEKAGLQGRKTNHSCRRTTVQRLVHAGLHPTVIKQLTGHKQESSITKYATASREMQSTMSDIVATGSMQYRNPLASKLGRNVPNQGANAITDPVNPAIGNARAMDQLRPIQPIQNIPPDSVMESACNDGARAVAIPNMFPQPQPGTSFQQQGLPYGLLQHSTFSGNATININYNCLSQSQTQNHAHGNFKRIKRNYIESDSESD